MRGRVSRVSTRNRRVSRVSTRNRRTRKRSTRNRRVSRVSTRNRRVSTRNRRVSTRNRRTRKRSTRNRRSRKRSTRNRRNRKRTLRGGSAAGICVDDDDVLKALQFSVQGGWEEYQKQLVLKGATEVKYGVGMTPNPLTIDDIKQKNLLKEEERHIFIPRINFRVPTKSQPFIDDFNLIEGLDDLNEGDYFFRTGGCPKDEKYSAIVLMVFKNKIFRQMPIQLYSQGKENYLAITYATLKDAIEMGKVEDGKFNIDSTNGHVVKYVTNISDFIKFESVGAGANDSVTPKNYIGSKIKGNITLRKYLILGE